MLEIKKKKTWSVTSPLLNSHSLRPERQKDADEYVNVFGPLGDHTLCHACLTCARTQSTWWQWGTTSPRTGLCSTSTRGTSSGCSTWTGWRQVRHTHTHTLIDALLWNVILSLIDISVCSSYTLAVCVHFCCDVFREAVRLHCEEESHASGGVKEGHFWVWYVWHRCWSQRIRCMCLHFYLSSFLFMVMIFHQM